MNITQVSGVFQDLKIYYCFEEQNTGNNDFIEAGTCINSSLLSMKSSFLQNPSSVLLESMLPICLSVNKNA